MKKEKPKKPKKETSKKLPPQEEKDEAFNYGGLPPRNLKKNLGC